MSRPLYDVACPKCGAEPGWHCRSLTTNRVTDTHSARMDEQMRYRQQQRQERRS
jgi:hypothetical protein